MKKKQIFYHYTNGQRIYDIIRSGKLIVSEAEKKMGVKPPALWLSTNELWEGTAVKPIMKGREQVWLDMEGLHLLCGLYRFVIELEKERVCSWAKYKYKSNTPEAVYNSMTAIGIKQGANPRDWYVVFHDINLTACQSIEKWDGKFWRKIDASTIMREVE